jgi:CHAD domain-containing protein
MSAEKVNDELTKSITEWWEFKKAFDKNGVGAVDELHRLQDALTRLRNQLNSLESAVGQQLKALLRD